MIDDSRYYTHMVSINVTATLTPFATTHFAGYTQCPPHLTDDPVHLTSLASTLVYDDAKHP